MLYKSTMLNIRLSKDHMMAALGLAAFYALLSAMSGGFNIAAGIISLLFFWGSLMAFALGSRRIFFDSVFGESRTLYMMLPVSNRDLVLSKVFAASFYGGIWFALLFSAGKFQALSLLGPYNIFGNITESSMEYPFGSDRYGLFETVAIDLIEGGVEPKVLGLFVFLMLIWMLILSMLLSAVAFAGNIIASSITTGKLRGTVTMVSALIMIGVCILIRTLLIKIVMTIGGGELSLGVIITDIIFAAAVLAGLVLASGRMLNKCYSG